MEANQTACVAFTTCSVITEALLSLHYFHWCNNRIMVCTGHSAAVGFKQKYGSLRFIRFDLLYFQAAVRKSQHFGVQTQHMVREMHGVQQGLNIHFSFAQLRLV